MEYNQQTFDKINDFLLVCEEATDIRSFSNAVIQGMSQFFSFDSALATLYDSNQKTSGHITYNYEESHENAIFQYYIHTDSYKSYELPFDLIENPNKPNIAYFDWEKEYEKNPNNEMVKDTILIFGKHYSVSLRFFDQNRRVRLAVLFNKKKKDFSYEEAEWIRFFYPHLNNIHKMIYRKPDTGSMSRIDAVASLGNLTLREKELVELLCNGYSPTTISTILSISDTTTRKHIAHIYEKLKVTTLQELLVFILNCK